MLDDPRQNNETKVLYKVSSFVADHMSNITLGKKYNLMAMNFSYWQPFKKKKKQHFSRMWKFLAHMEFQR
jgi:hypothetical protein